MNKTDIRRNRLKDWFTERTLPAREKSYLSQLITGRASFGERAARRLESEYGMPDNYLDTPYGEEEKTPKLGFAINKSIKYTTSQKTLNEQEQEILNLLQWLPSSEVDALIEEFKKKAAAYKSLVEEILAKQQKK
ncbi:hypothetical protein [Salmonella enterica]|uniref:hypothetical protein n=1 Tax=Salmonella enterica TaxID=28901 RepID=UPI003D323E2B|nr:hypothetical protein [Salmonella enterica]